MCTDQSYARCCRATHPLPWFPSLSLRLAQLGCLVHRTAEEPAVGHVLLMDLVVHNMSWPLLLRQVLASCHHTGFRENSPRHIADQKGRQTDEEVPVHTAAVGAEDNHRRRLGIAVRRLVVVGLPRMGTTAVAEEERSHLGRHNVVVLGMPSCDMEMGECMWVT